MQKKRKELPIKYKLLHMIKLEVGHCVWWRQNKNTKGRLFSGGLEPNLALSLFFKKACSTQKDDILI